LLSHAADMILRAMHNVLARISYRNSARLPVISFVYLRLFRRGTD